MLKAQRMKRDEFLMWFLNLKFSYLYSCNSLLSFIEKVMWWSVLTKNTCFNGSDFNLFIIMIKLHFMHPCKSNFKKNWFTSFKEVTYKSQKIIKKKLLSSMTYLNNWKCANYFVGDTIIGLLSWTKLNLN
jgi:hypothetical protein